MCKKDRISRSEPTSLGRALPPMRRIYMKKSCPKMVYVDLHHRKVTSENLCRTMQHRSCLTGSSFKTHWLIKIKALSIVIELEGAQQKKKHFNNQSI